MALYASDGKNYIYAADAKSRSSYLCLECRGPVRARRGKNRVPHFFHLQRSPRCRLYSKSEDHLLLQLQIQRLLSQAGQIEAPFFSIHRIADVLWEQEKIVFEIQCSPLDVLEAQNRTSDYRSLGYDVVWLLDDRIFNRRLIRPAEEFLRTQICYFFAFERFRMSCFYDQLEIILGRKRALKGCPLTVDLIQPKLKPCLVWPDNLPNVIKGRIQQSTRYFQGDLLHKVIEAANCASIAIYLARWQQLEVELWTANRSKSVFGSFFNRFVARPYLQMLAWALERADS